MQRVAVVTGGGGGIGLEIARSVVSSGGAVVIGDLNGDRGEQAVEALAAPDRVRFERVDVADEADLERLVRVATSRFGGVDMMFNNAGIGGAFGPIIEQSVDDWDTTFAVNVRSVFLGHEARGRAP